jgi:DNA polymerase-3 subunit alpha
MLIEQNNFLCIRGRVQIRPYREPEELEFKITSIQHLAEVAESIDTIRIELDIHDINPTLIEMITAAATQNKGKASLCFTIVDRSNDVKVKLRSRSFKIEPSTEFINFLETNDINYFINI